MARYMALLHTITPIIPKLHLNFNGLPFDIVKTGLSVFHKLCAMKSQPIFHGLPGKSGSIKNSDVFIRCLFPDVVSENSQL